MATDPNKKYLTKPVRITQKGLGNILNAGSTSEEDESFGTSPDQLTLSITGKSHDDTAAILKDNELNPLGTTAGVTSAQEEQREIDAGFKNEKEALSKLTANAEEQMGIQQYYNESGAIVGAASNVVSGAKMGGKVVLDTLAIGVLKGGYFNSIANTLQEEEWRSRVNWAISNNDESYKNFTERMGFYHESENVNGFDKITSFVDFASLQADASAFSKLSEKNLKIRNDDGTYRDPNADEMSWFYRYRNLNRSRVADQKTRTIQNLYNQEMADYVTWIDEDTDSLGNKYTKARAASNVLGGAVGSALLFELAAAPAGVVNFAGQAVRAKSVVKAATTANKAWRGSVLTNPYFLSKGGGIYASATGGTATFAGAFMQQYVETKAQALAAGWDPVTAGRIAAKNAGFQAIVESVSYERFLHKYLMGGREFGGFFTHAMLPEGLEEVSQTAIDDYFVNKYGMDSTTMKELVGNMWMSFLSGAGGSIAIGGIHTATNVGATVLTGDYKKMGNVSDPNVNTKEWLKQIGVDSTKANTKENTQNIRPQQAEDALSKFQQFVDDQKKQKQESESKLQPVSDTNQQLQLPYNINYDWAPSVIGSMNKGQRMAFDEFCQEHDVDVNNHEELREALLVWTGNDAAQFQENAQSEDPQMDKAAAELNAVMDVIASQEFELEPPAATQERYENEKQQIMAALKEDFKRRAKQVDPKITNAQIEAAWSNASKLFEADLDSGEITMAIADEAMEQLAIVAQDARLAAATKEATVKAAKKTQNVIDTKTLRAAITAKGTERYKAQWDIAQQLLENRIVMAIGDRRIAKAISTLVRKAYYNSLASTPDVTPVEFVMKAAPDFITQAALRRHDIRIAGLQGLESKMQQIGINDTIDYIKAVNGILAKQIEQYKGMEDGPERTELAQSILYGLFGEDAADIKIEDALAFLETVTREEMKIHKYIGSGGIVSKFSESDFTLMALLRLRGASETEILKAFGVSDQKTLDSMAAYYNDAVNTFFPAPNRVQRASLEALGAQVRGEKAEGEVTGATQQAEDGEWSPFVFLTGEEVGETITHEVGHWIEQLAKQVAEFANNQVLMALGQKQNLTLGEVSETLPFSNRNIAALYNRIVEVLSQREETSNLTPREISETFAEFLTRYLVQYGNIDPELAAAFQGLYGARTANDNVVGSVYNKLSQAQKTAIRKILDETFDTQVLEHAQNQIQEADNLRGELMNALGSVDKKSVTESEAYQLYKKLTDYLGARAANSEILNRGLSRMVKAYEAFKQNGNNNILKGVVVATALDTINELEADGQKAMIGIMYEQAQVGNPPGFMTDAEVLAQQQRAEEKDMKEFQEDEDGKDWLDRILEKNDKTKGEAYFSRRQNDGRTATEKMRGVPTLKEGLRETYRGFRMKGFKEAFNSLTASVVEYANKVHPMLGAAIRAACYEINEMKTYNAEIKERWLGTFAEYNEWALKNGKSPISEEDFQVYHNLLINHKRDKAFEYMEKKFADNPEIQEQLHGMHMVVAARLDECYRLMLQMGFQLEEVENYFPSIVKDREGYAMKVYRDILAAEEATGKKIMPDWQRKLKGKYETEVRKAIRRKIKEAQKQGKELSMVDLVNAVNAELGHPREKFSAPHVYKVQNMNKGMDYNKYYMDVFDAFNAYTNDIANKFLNYRLVGKAKMIVDQQGNKKLSDESGIIGSMLTGLQFANIQGYEYDPDAENAFMNALEQTLSRKDSGDDIWVLFKQVQTYMTLGRLTSAFNQFLELAPTMMRYGLVPSIKSMFQAMSKENPLTIHTLGIQPLNEAEKLDTNGLLGKLNQFMLKTNGFTKADILMKNTVIVATLTNAQQMLARDEEYGNENETYGQRRFHRAFDETFPSPAYSEQQKAQIKQDLKDGKLTTDVKLFLRNALAATQPIDLAEVPALYNSLGNFGRSIYFLSVVSIKQMRYIWDQFVQDYRNGGVKDAAINMSRFLWFSCLVGVPPDWLKDIVHGKQPNIRETAFFSPLQYFLVNKYFTSVLKDKGLSAAAGMRFTVGTALIDDMARAILNKEPWYMARVVPFGGELLDHWYGVAHKQAVRHKENINTYEPVSKQLIKKPLTKQFQFLGWKI